MKFALIGISLICLSSACRTTGGSNPRRFADRVSEKPLPKDLVDANFPASKDMTKTYFRQSYKNLPDENFETKWSASLESPLHFFRSYANTYFDEVSRLPFPGAIASCLGDAHPDNFAFLWFGQEDFRYLYNDVDAAAACPVAFDALRYFTALKLWAQDDGLVDEVRAYYIHALKGNEASEYVLSTFKPPYTKMNQVIHESWLDGEKIKLNEGVQALSPELMAEFAASMAAHAGAFVKGPILDSALVNGTGQRYYALTKDPSFDLQLIELRELNDPAAARGDWSKTVAISRAEILNQIWGTTWPQFFGFSKFQSKDFQVRSRLEGYIDTASLPREQKLAVLAYQATLIARLHRSSISKADSFGLWLKAQIDFMAKRWRAAYTLNKG